MFQCCGKYFFKLLLSYEGERMEKCLLIEPTKSLRKDSDRQRMLNRHDSSVDELELLYSRILRVDCLLEEDSGHFTCRVVGKER